MHLRPCLSIPPPSSLLLEQPVFFFCHFGWTLRSSLVLLGRALGLGLVLDAGCWVLGLAMMNVQPIRWDEALAALLRALTVPDMPMQVQLERSIEAAVLCEGMGLKV